MAPNNTKANYKTYEAQARMVRAIVAAHPDVKWNYKEIAACYGSDMTEHALNHRFRKLRSQALIIQEGRKKGLDAKGLACDENNLPATKEAVDKKNIAKYFGQSTADGIQFQFRGIKKDAEVLRKVENSGGDVAHCLTLGGGTNLAPGSVTSTPSKSNGRNAATTPSSRGTAGSAAASRKRQRQTVDIIKRSSSDDEDDFDVDGNDTQDNWSDREETPTKRRAGLVTGNAATPGQENGSAPRRAAAIKANDTIADASAQLQSSDESPNESRPPVRAAGAIAAASAPSTSQTPTYRSIFGSVEPKHTAATQHTISHGLPSEAFTSLGTDPYMSTTMNASSSYSESFYRHPLGMDDGDDDGYGDGEI